MVEYLHNLDDSSLIAMPFVLQHKVTIHFNYAFDYYGLV